MTRGKNTRRGKWGAIGISLLLIVALLVLSLPGGVAAVGSPPHRFWGKAYMNNVSVDDGTEVSVWSLGGAEYASTTTFTLNSTPGQYLIDVPGTSEGEPLIFRVTGINAKTYNQNGVEIVTVYFHFGGSGDDTFHSNVTLKAETPPHILKFSTSSPSQSIDAGQPSAPMTIQHYNENDILSPVSEDTPIRLTSSSTQGCFSAAASPWGNVTTVTMLAGDNSASFYYKDTKAGTPTVTASRVGWQSATQPETIKPLSATQLAVTGISDPVAAFAASGVTVTAKDSYGNTATSYRGTIHFTSSDLGATLPVDYTFQDVDNGVKTFVGAVILTITGKQWVMATDTAPPSIYGVQTAITVTSAPAARLQITGSTTMTAGGSNPLTITALDQGSNVVTDYTGLKYLIFSGPGIAPGGQTPKVAGSSVGSATPVSFTNGVSDAGAANLVAYNAETTVVDASDGTYSSSGGWGLTLTVNPAAANHLVVTGSGSMDSGSTNELTVTAKDGYGNVVTSYSGTKILTFSGPEPLGDLYPKVEGVNVGTATAVNFSSGVSDAGAATLIAYKVQTKTVDVTDGSISSTGGYGLVLTVNIAGAHLVVTSASGTATAGVGKDLTITARDQYGTVITSYNGDKSLIFSGPGVAPDGQQPKVETKTLGIAVSVTFTNGVSNPGAATLTAYKAETTTVDVTDGNINSFGSPTYDLDLTVNAAPMTPTSRLEVTGLDTMIAGGTNELTIVAKDAYGNVATSYSGGKTLTFSGPSAAPGGQKPTIEGILISTPRSVTFTGGVSATNAATLIAYKAETTTVDVTDDTYSSSASAAYDLDLIVTPATASQLTVSGITDPVVAGVASSVTVTAKDAYGNVATSYTGTVHFTSSDTQAALPSNDAFLPGNNGVKTFSNAVTMKTVGEQWVRATDTVTSSITGQQTGITVNAGALSRIAFITAVRTITAGQPSAVITVQTQDAYGNPVNVPSASTLSLNSTSASGSFSLSNTTWANTTSVTITSGQKSASFYYKDTVAGTPTITVAKSGWTSAMQQETITAAAAVKMVFTTIVQTVTAGQPSAAITVQTQDTYGNPANVISNTTLTLSSTSATGLFSLSATSWGNITSVTITSGQKSGSFYYKDTLAGTPTITVAKSGWTSITQPETITPAAASVLVVTGIPDPVVAGTASGVTVTAKDAYGNTVTNYRGTVHFTSSDAQAALPGNYTFISGDNGVKTFSSGVMMKTAGEQSVRATDTVSAITGEQTGITVTPAAISKLVFTTPPRGVAVGEASLVITVQTQDTYGNPSVVSANTALTLNSTSATGLFSLSAISWSNINSVTIYNGQNSASFYYKDTEPGTPTIMVTKSGWTSATQQETVTTIVIIGEVDLQRLYSKGDPSWVTNLTVTLLQANTTTVVATYNVTTDSQGKFTIANVSTGTYDIRVKGAHTLSNLVTWQVIVAGTNSVYFGTLREGDANNDNAITGWDYAYLYTYFWATSGTGLNCCDFNGDGVVNIFDYRLLWINYNQIGA